MRTRMSGGVGRDSQKAVPYPDLADIEAIACVRKSHRVDWPQGH